MVGPYPGLPRDVAATVPRRPPLRHSWVREAPQSHPSHPAPLEVEVTPYPPPPQDTPSTPGLVSRARALFESPQEVHPSSPHRDDTPDWPKCSLNTPEDTIVTPDSPEITPKYTPVTPDTPETATEITLRIHPYQYTNPAPRRRYTPGPPPVDEFGNLIVTPPSPRPLVSIKKITPIVIPRVTPRGSVAKIVSPQKRASPQFSPQIETPLITHQNAPQYDTPPCKTPLNAQTGSWGEGGDGGEWVGVRGGEGRPRAQQTPRASVPERVRRATSPPRHPNAPQTMLKPPPGPHPECHPYTPFSQIPLHLLECLEESSVDPPTPLEGAGGAGRGDGVTTEHQDTPTVTPATVTPASVTCFEKASPITPTPEPPTPSSPHPHPPRIPSRTPTPSPPSTLIKDHFRGFCSEMLKNPEIVQPRPSDPAHAHSRSLDEELWAAGVYFRRPGSPPRPLTKDRRHLVRKVSSGVRKDVIVESDLEESVLRELDSSLAGLGVSSSGSSGSSSSGSGSSSSTPCPPNPEPLNLIEEVMVERESLSSLPPPPPASPSPPPPPPPSTVTLKAFYQYPTPPPPPPPPLDSDSGHESGATSPCGTLTGEDVKQTPPASPHGAHSPHQDTGVGVSVVGGEPRGVGVSGVSLEPRPPSHFVVVAIDFGTTYSGYAFSFTSDPDSVHMMKQWQGGDPGVQNQKTPTTLLLTPEGAFHSLGYLARDTYHDLDPAHAATWMYFDRFKMVLHADQSLNRETLIEATNGRRLPALQVFSHALRYFRDHALRELSDQAGVCGGVGVLEEDVRWVITVPAIWSHPAKQFMRSAAYQAGMGSLSRPDQLLIALEPEVAAIYCRRLRRHQLLPPPSSTSSTSRSLPPHLQQDPAPPPSPDLNRDTVYAVVDCGGGTVDITVHQMTDRTSGHLKELHKATGGPYGSTGVDAEFEKLLETIFSSEFLQVFRRERPAAHVDLMIAFEARKRNASPRRATPLNIALPFSFIDLYRKMKGKDVESAVRKHQHLGVKWSSQGMLRLDPDTMTRLFTPTLNSITKAIEEVVGSPEVRSLQYMFLVGGFAESEVLQTHIRDTFSPRVRVVIPQGTSLAILRGAVQFGLDPGIVTVRRSRLTYGVGVLNKYDPRIHPEEKRVRSGGGEWCADILDRFVVVDQSVAVGDVVVRSYTPATPAQRTVILHLYATHRHDVQFVTEAGVERVGTLHLELDPPTPLPPHKDPGGREEGRGGRDTREISVNMKFGDTEVKATAVDHFTKHSVRVNIDFLAL